MLNSIVHIKSSDPQNKSFGTGFVIDKNEQGTYILTCEHVLRAVIDAQIDSYKVRTIVEDDFLDMAIVCIDDSKYDEVTIQLENCKSLNIKSIAFSSFKKGLVQKSTIHATLFKDFIELHSTQDDSFYLIKKMKAHPDYGFSKGNSGAPIICEETGNVIAMMSNKEGDSIAYSIGVSCLKRLLEQLSRDESSLEKHQKFYNKMSDFNKNVEPYVQRQKSPKNRAIYNMDELRKEHQNMLTKVKEKLSKLKYFLLGIGTILAFYGAYGFIQEESKIPTDYYSITNIPSNETLNVRVDGGRNAKIVDELSYGTRHISVSKCKYNQKENSKWCYIKYKNIKGWVHAHYIIKEANIHSH